MCWNRKRFCSCNKLCMLKLPFLFQNSLFTGYFQKHYEVPGLVFFKGPFWGAYFWRGLYSEGFIYCMKGNLPFKIDWASLIVGSKLTVFGLFYFIFEGIFPSTSPQRAYIWKGDLMDGFLCYWFGGLIFKGAYFQKFSVFYLLFSPHGG